MVNLTDTAKEYLSKVGDPNVYLSVNAGGCSGFSYVWETTDKEAHVENLHIDPIAEMYVIGCTIDYVTELGGSFHFGCRNLILYSWFGLPGGDFCVPDLSLIHI